VTAESMTSNPLLGEFKTPFGVPPFDKIRVEHFLPALQAGIKEQLEGVGRIVDNSAAPNFANTVAALDFSGMSLARTSRIFHSLLAADTNDALDKIAKTIAPLLAAHKDRIVGGP